MCDEVEFLQLKSCEQNDVMLMGGGLVSIGQESTKGFFDEMLNDSVRGCFEVE